MPSRKRSSRSRRDPFHGFQIERASGRYYISLGPANANGVVSFGLTPAFLGARLADLANLFLEFRFTRLRVSWLATGYLGGPTIVGYYAQYEPAVPTSMTEASETDYCQICFAAQTTRSSITVPLAVMGGNRAVTWYRTIPAAGADDNLEYQGMLFGAGLTPTTGLMPLWVEYDIEFRGRAPGVVSVTRPIRALWDTDSKEVPDTWADLDDEKTNSDLLEGTALGNQTMTVGSTKPRQPGGPRSGTGNFPADRAHDRRVGVVQSRL